MICPICQKDGFMLEIQLDTYSYIKCSSCGLVMRNPIVLVQSYSEHESHRDYMFRELKMYKDFETKILEIKKVKSEGKFLDVGCNYGIFMKVAQDYGYEVYGIEPSKPCVDYGKERYGFDIQNGILNKKEGPYDIITFNHVLEHSENPLEVLKIAYESLNDGGIVYIAFPNYGCEKAQTLKRDWEYLMASGHNYQFTLESASRLLKEAGFTVVWNPELTSNLVLIAQKPPIQKFQYAKNHIDIILPVYNHLDYTRQFIKTLYQTSDQPFQLIIVNDGSNDGTKQYLDSLKRKEITVIHNDENMGFLKSVNKGIKEGINDFVLIANNDIIFKNRGWLSTMKNFTANPNIGATCLEYLHNQVDFGVMSLFMTKRDILYKIGILDENLAPGQCEDLDLSIRLEQEGFKVQQIPLPVGHLNNNGDQGGRVSSELSNINIQKIIQKYDWLPKTRNYKIVFHINNQLWIGGIESLLSCFAKYRKQGWEMIVASPQDGRMREEIERNGGKVFIGNFEQIYTLMNLIKPDVVHTHTNGALTYANYLANNISPKPIRIETVHSPGGSNATLENLDALVAVSQDTYGRQTFPKTHLIYNGIDFERCKLNKYHNYCNCSSGLASTDENHNEICYDCKKLLKLPRFHKEKTIIGKISRIAKDKKVTDFILAAYKLTQKYPGKLEFHLVGEDAGRYFKDDCVRFVNQLGLKNFKFYPETRDMALLNEWDIGLQPTSSEGFGLVTAEMMAMKMPIVTYDSYANKEIVIHGENGFVVPIDDVDGLVDYSCQLIDNGQLRNQMAEKGLEYVKKFNAQVMTKQYYDLYDQLLEERKNVQ